MMSVSEILSKINKNMDSKEDLLPLLDSLGRRTGGAFQWARKKSIRTNVVTCVKMDFIELIIDIMQKYHDEEILIRSCCRVLYNISFLPDTVMPIPPTETMLQLGARALLDECMEANRDDKGEVPLDIKLFNNILNQKGGQSAVRDIRRQILALEFVKTQSLLKDAYGDKYKRKEEQKSADVAYNIKVKKGPEASLVDWLYTLDYSQCIATIVDHMGRYKDVLSVQEAGCESFYEYGRSAVDVIPCIKGGGCEALRNSFDYFPTSSRLIWKAATAVNEMCLQHQALASELGKVGVVKRLVVAWEKMMDANDAAVLQQIIWALGALARIDNNIERFKQEGVFSIIKYCVLDLPAENKKNAHKGKDALKTPIIVPLSLRSLSINDIKALSAPKEEVDTQKKVKTTAFRGFKAKKSKFGRAGDDLGGSDGTAMIDDDKKAKKKKNKPKGKGAEVAAQ